MSYRLLAVDLDGTLLRRDGTIHDADRAAIARLCAAGVPVTIATGRLFSGSREAARMAGITGPIACVDGSHIVDAPSGRELVHHGIAGEHAEALRRALEPCAAASFVFAHDAIVHDARGNDFAPYVCTWSPDLRVVDRVTSHPFWEHERGVLAVVSVGDDETIAALVERVHHELDGVATALSFPLARRPGTSASIVRAHGPTKGTAIEHLAAHYGVTPAEVVVVGDWLNDLAMFRVAGCSFAMAQAPDAVKDAATFHLDADGAVGGGVAEAIARAWGAL